MPSDHVSRMKHRALFLVPVLALAAVACGSDDGDGVAVDSPWARTSAAGQTTGAIYFELTADQDDRLVGASVSASVAGTAEVHEVIMVDDDMEMSDDEHEHEHEDDKTDEGTHEGHDDHDHEEHDHEDHMDESGEMEGSHDMDDMDGMSGQMRMQELEGGLALTAGETVTFEPGGYHIMLLDLAEPLQTGDEIDLTLEFAEGGEQSVTVEVMETAP